MDRCFHCGKSLALPKEEKSKRIRLGLKKSKKKIGRPRSFDHEKARKLRATGASFTEIAEYFKVTRGTVCYALKMKN